MKKIKNYFEVIGIIGVIPAAGKGIRLGLGCKALVKVKGKYLIEYAINNMKDIGIFNIIIIQNGKNIEKALGYEYENIKLNYVQQKERKGIAHAISLTKDLVRNNDMIVIFSDIICDLDIPRMLSYFNRLKPSISGVFAVKRLKDYDKDLIKKSYGIKFGNPDEIIEKPEEVKELGPLLGLGVYMFTSKIFYYIKKTPKGKKGEIEITDTLNEMAKKIDVQEFVLDGFYTNINTKGDLEELK